VISCRVAGFDLNSWPLQASHSDTQFALHVTKLKQVGLNSAHDRAGSAVRGSTRSQAL
jgi:hypothetical protein